MEKQSREIEILNTSLLFKILSEILFHIVFFVQSIVYLLVYQIKIEGRKNLTSVDKGILIANHLHYLDPGFAAQAVWPRRTYFTGLEDTFTNNRFFSYFIRALGGLPIPKKNPGRIVKVIGSILDNSNRFIHIFPEGELLIANRELQSFQKGAFSLAYFFEVPIIPIVEVQQKRRFWPAPKIIMIIGSPIYPSAYHELCDSKEERIKKMKRDARSFMQDTINLYFD